MGVSIRSSNESYSKEQRPDGGGTAKGCQTYLGEEDTESSVKRFEISSDERRRLLAAISGDSLGLHCCRSGKKRAATGLGVAE